MALRKQLHRTFMDFMNGCNLNIKNIARGYFNTTLKKTQFSSHIEFLKRCKQSKVIPTGFSLNHHGPREDNLTNSRLNTTITACSRLLMNITLESYTKKVSSLSHKREEFKRDLFHICSSYDYRSIAQTVHCLNRDYFWSLNSHKDKKLSKLLRNQPKKHQPRPEKLVVTIPDDLQLSNTEKDILGRGLKFVPSQPKPDNFTLKKDLETYYRRIKLHAHFNNADKTICDNYHEEHPYPRYKPKSTWTPRDIPDSSVTKYIDKCREDVSKLDLNTRPKPNMTRHERSCLRDLSSRDDIVIKRADKGGAVVVWRKDLYTDECLKQLTNETFYKELDNDTTEENNQKVLTCIEEEIAANNLPPEATILVPDKPRCSKFYALPKIHKPDNPGRPIVSACGCPTERISQVVDEILRPLVQELPSYVKDSTHALNLLKAHSFPTTSKKLLFTMDVKSLYSVIPHADGLLALNHFLDLRPIQQPPTSTILRLAELVLTLNTFSFEDRFYSQERGVAMGTRMGPSYANIFMGYLEKKLAEEYNNTFPELYCRFIDDIFGVTTMPKDDLMKWIDFVQNLHPNIDFTFSVSEEEMTFLDLKFSIAGGKIESTISYKTTDSHSYLKYTSFHPKTTRDAIPYSQLLRLRRLTSTDSAFTPLAEDMLTFFRAREYPDLLLNTAHERVKDLSQDSLLRPKEPKHQEHRIPFVTAFHPAVHMVYKLLKENWKLLEEEPMFASQPLMSFRRGKSIGDTLVRSSTGTSTPELGGTFQCQRTRCFTCQHILSENIIHGPTGSFNIRKSYTCISKNIVYCIACRCCGDLYIGETKRRLGDRIVEHLRDIRKHNTASPVATHFNGNRHSLEDVAVAVLIDCDSDHQRKATEMRLINKLGTLDPLGMNLDFTYNV